MGNTARWRFLAWDKNGCGPTITIILLEPIIFRAASAREIYPFQLTVEKANKSNHLADYLDLIFIIDSEDKLLTRNVMSLTSTLSIFHSFPATYHLALLIVCTFHSSLDMHDAAHTMMISDINHHKCLVD